MKQALLAFLAVLGFSFAAQATTRAQVIANISNNVIMQTYSDFARDTQDLHDSVQTLIVNPTQTNLETAQNAWRRARGTYEISEGFLFGPIDALGVDPMIDSWPLALTDLKKILKSDYVLDLDFVRGLSSEVQGFHGVEYILFGEGIVTNNRDVATITAREFEYLAAATTVLKEQVDLLIYAWSMNLDPEDQNSPSYLSVISNPSAQNNYYNSEQAVILEFAHGMTFILAEASGAKLPDATGEEIEDANARLEESPFSWNTIADYVSNIDSVYNVYMGSYGSHKGAGIYDLVANTNPVLAEKVKNQMLNVRSMIINVGGPTNMPFGKVIKDVEGRKRIFAAIKAIQALQETLDNQVIPVL